MPPHHLWVPRGRTVQGSWWVKVVQVPTAKWRACRCAQLRCRSGCPVASTHPCMQGALCTQLRGWVVHGCQCRTQATRIIAKVPLRDFDASECSVAVRANRFRDHGTPWIAGPVSRPSAHCKSSLRVECRSAGGANVGGPVAWSEDGRRITFPLGGERQDLGELRLRATD